MSPSWMVRVACAPALDAGPGTAPPCAPDPLELPPLGTDPPVPPPPGAANEPPPDELDVPEAWLPGGPLAERLVSLEEQALRLRASAAMARKCSDSPGSFIVSPSESTGRIRKKQAVAGGRGIVGAVRFESPENPTTVSVSAQRGTENRCATRGVG